MPQLIVNIPDDMWGLFKLVAPDEGADLSLFLQGQLSGYLNDRVSGLTPEELKELFGKLTARALSQRVAVRPQSRGGVRRGRPPIAKNQERDDRIVQMYMSGQSSMPEIAAQVGLSRERVYQIVRARMAQEAATATAS